MRIIPTSSSSKGTILTLLALSATITISSSANPLSSWGYEIAVFVLAGWESFRASIRRNSLPWMSLAWMATGLWGFGQLLSGATVYRWATLNASLQNLALAATALGGFLAFREPRARAAFLRWIPWIGCGIALTSVLAYWTSPQKILWLFQTDYPDNWGPFPSRNNFAQFLELCLPAALYQLSRARSRSTAVIPPAAILGAGIASASRAGTALLLMESVACVGLLRRGLRGRAAAFALASAAFAGVAGAATLAGRLAAPDPFQLRREIFLSAERMIAQHPWKGFGLGTFATVYPEYAIFDSGASVDHAHNDWLEWTAGGGLVYASLWAVAAFRAVRPAVSSVWGLGAVAVFLHALVDYPFARIGVAAWVFLILGALEHERRKVSARPHYGGGENSETANRAVWISGLRRSPEPGDARRPERCARRASFDRDGPR